MRYGIDWLDYPKDIDYYICKPGSNVSTQDGFTSQGEYVYQVLDDVGRVCFEDIVDLTEIKIVHFDVLGFCYLNTITNARKKGFSWEELQGSILSTMERERMKFVSTAF